MSEWVWVQEGSLPWCPYVEGISSRNALWVTVGFCGAWPPFFAIPSSIFKYVFWVDLLMSFGQSHMRWLGLPHQRQFWFLFWYNSTTFAKQVMYLTDWPDSSTLPNASTSSSAQSSVSSCLYCSTPGSSSATSFPMVSAWVAKVWLLFSLCKGNRFPGVWECITFDPSVTAVLGGRGSLASAHLSSF